MGFRLHLAVFLVLVATGTRAQLPDICTEPNRSALACLVNAVEYTYRMCQQVHSIVVLEFGLDGARDAVNGAKYHSCVDKHVRSLAGPFREALREARISPDVIRNVKVLHGTWLQAMQSLHGQPGETVETYMVRVTEPYLSFSEHAERLYSSFEEAAGLRRLANTARARPAGGK